MTEQQLTEQKNKWILIWQDIFATPTMLLPMEELFPEHDLVLVDSMREAYAALLSKQQPPEILMLDSRMGETPGEDIFDTLSNYMSRFSVGKKANSYVLYLSNEISRAQDCKNTSILRGISEARIFSAEILDVFPALAFSDGIVPESFHPSVFSLNRLINIVTGTDLPEEETELSKSNHIPSGTETVRKWTRGQIASHEALENFIAINRNRPPYTEQMLPWVNLEYVNNSHKFQDGRGGSVQGKAQFSIRQALLCTEQNRPIFICAEFNPDWYPHIKKMAGLIILNEQSDRHLLNFAAACNTPILIGANANAKVSDCWAEIDGKTIRENDIMTICNAGADNALACERVFMEQRVTVPYLPDIHKIHNQWLRKTEVRQASFLSNIDSLEQSASAARLSDGIGLARTEHLVLADPEATQALRTIYLQPYPNQKHFKKLSKLQAKSYRTLFADTWQALDQREITEDFPVCVRLLDAPASQFMGKQDLDKFNALVSPDNQRGVQIALQRKGLYEGQLASIFAAYADHLCAHPPADGQPNIRLDVMAPMVKTVQEAQIVKDMAASAAEKCKIKPDQYRFGIMIETKECLRNIAELARQVAFLSIGSNDLSRQLLPEIPWNDSRAMQDWLQEDTTRADPRVALHDQVTQQIIELAATARTANPDIRIGLCGDHASDLRSLNALRPANLDYVSMPPSERNHVALRADAALSDYQLRHAETLRL